MWNERCIRQSPNSIIPHHSFVTLSPQVCLVRPVCLDPSNTHTHTRGSGSNTAVALTHQHIRERWPLIASFLIIFHICVNIIQPDTRCDSLSGRRRPNTVLASGRGEDGEESRSAGVMKQKSLLSKIRAGNLWEGRRATSYSRRPQIYFQSLCVSRN